MKREKNKQDQKILKIELDHPDPASNDLSLDQLILAWEGESGNKPDSNSRCVPVGTKSIAPGGRNKKELFKAKREFVKFRCSVYEKKLLYIKAKRSRLSVSEFCRRSVFNLEVKERLSEDHIEVLKTFSKFHNNFKSIGNMFRQKNPDLTSAVYALAEEIKQQLQKLQK